LDFFITAWFGLAGYIFRQGIVDRFTCSPNSKKGTCFFLFLSADFDDELMWRAVGLPLLKFPTIGS
jgi:hypothetical protein